MDDLDVLARDFGFKPSGKSAPMRSDGVERSNTRSSSPLVGDGPLLNDIFGGPPKYASTGNNTTTSSRGFDYDSIFKSSSTNEPSKKSSSSLPVYDKPVYDDDIFDGLPGLKSKPTVASATFDDDIFASKTSAPPASKQRDHYDDLLRDFGRTNKSEKNYSDKSSTGFDDLFPGFRRGSSAGDGKNSETTYPRKSSADSNKTNSNMMDDPFGVGSTSSGRPSSPGLFSNPLEELTKLRKPRNAKTGSSPVSGEVFDDLDPLGDFGKSVPPFSSNINNKGKDGSTAKTQSTSQSGGKSSFTYAESPPKKRMPVHKVETSHQNVSDMPDILKDSHRPVNQNFSAPSDVDRSFHKTSSPVDMSPKSSEHVQQSDEVWLSVSEVPLFTQPTSAPPPTKPPPPIRRRGFKTETGPFASNIEKRGNDFIFSSNNDLHSQSSNHSHPNERNSVVSQIDELEDFAMGKKSNVDEVADGEVDTNSAAAAMKEAMDRAQAKFKHAKEVREKENTRATRNREAVQVEREEQVRLDSQERELKENQEKLEHERQQREREEEEREQRRLEREKARQAVERANREARERAMADARERAASEARLKAEKAAVEKVHTEARERAERAAVQRAQAEARERAAVGARERAEKAAAEAQERANAEVREKEVREKAAVAKAEMEARRRAERAAAERITAEARERAAAAAAAAAKMNQQNNDSDLESFFNMGSRPSSEPRTRKNSSSRGAEGPRRTSPSDTASSNMRKASSTNNIVDDLSSIFGATPSSGEFQEVEGESEERRRARMERHQRTQERAAKALAEKNQRDLQTQRDQEERDRISEALDLEIKRWAAGKEGNLRAMLSTLQYVLWPGCGWQPISLTDLITGASVKKAYRKATLSIHPDKVQQKGATLQQKYVAEKVFDLLKEAWNKFNSEELF